MEINGQKVVLNYGLRAMFAWESITGNPFEIKTLMDTYVFFYACIIANQENPSIDFNEFIDACDKNPELIVEFNDFMQKEMKKREVISPKKKAGIPRRNSQ